MSEDRLLDFDTAAAEARSIQSALKITKKTVLPKIEHLQMKELLGKLPENITFWYDVTDQQLDAMKIQNPKAYKAEIFAQQAAGSIAGRDGESMARYLSEKLYSGLKEKEITLHEVTVDHLVGDVVGDITKDTDASLQTRVDLFQVGISSVEATKLLKNIPVNSAVNIAQALNKQERFTQSIVSENDKK